MPFLVLSVSHWSSPCCLVETFGVLVGMEGFSATPFMTMTPSTPTASLFNFFLRQYQRSTNGLLNCVLTPPSSPSTLLSTTPSGGGGCGTIDWGVSWKKVTELHPSSNLVAAHNRHDERSSYCCHSKVVWCGRSSLAGRITNGKNNNKISQLFIVCRYYNWPPFRAL